MKLNILKNLLGAAVLAAFPAAALAADDAPAGSAPTFAKDVLPILQANCQSCHRPSGLNLGGMVAPMALMSYEDVRPWAKSVAKSVKSGDMPPWHAAPEFDGKFHNQRKLTPEEIDTVIAWANAGAPKGDPKDAPPAIEWPTAEWSMGTPDLVLTFDEPFEVKDDVEDLNIDIATDITAEQLPEDRFIVAMEYKAGCDVVHHIIGYTLQPRPGSKAKEFIMLGGMAPGTEPERYPEGYGVLLRAGSRFVFQMHYHKEPGPGTAKIDRSQVAFKFAPKDAKLNRLYTEAIGNIRELRVPPGEPAYRITSERTFPRDITLVSMLPHMHLRGDYAKYVAIYPDGKEETLLEVPEWSFEWQTSYKFKEPRELPGGTKIRVTLGYDNSANNPANPDPTKEVVWGAPTTDEMNLGWTYWAYKNPTPEDKAPQPIGGRNTE